MAKEEVKTQELKQKQVNIRVKDGEQFYSNEASINFNPNEIIFDFKCLTHANELAGHNSIVLRHNFVLLSPFHAKSFLIMLNKAVKDYESKFGEIKKPESMKKAEKMIKKDQKPSVVEKVKDKMDSYFG